MFPSRSAEDEATAYHEAGHAVMAALRDLPPLSGSIVPAGNRVAGRTEFPDVPPAFKNYLGTSAEKRAYIETRVLIEVAATIAHDMHTPGRVHDAGDAYDLQRARAFIEQNASWAENDREAYLQSLCNLARPMIATNWAWVQAVALALIEQRELTGVDVMRCRPA
jgi:hypothetical protein